MAPRAEAKETKRRGRKLGPVIEEQAAETT
jgi:hypothetical protein